MDACTDAQTDVYVSVWIDGGWTDGSWLCKQTIWKIDVQRKKRGSAGITQIQISVLRKPHTSQALAPETHSSCMLKFPFLGKYRGILGKCLPYASQVYGTENNIIIQAQWEISHSNTCCKELGGCLLPALLL